MIPSGPTQTSEAIREALRQVFSAPHYQWDRPRSLLDVVGGWLNGLSETLQRLHASHPLGYYVLIGFLTAVLLAILAHFAYVLWQVVKPQPAPATQREDGATASLGSGWYLQQARQLMLDGRHAEALGFRFRALLLTLDRRQILRFHPSKTPAEYVSELRLGSDGQNAFVSLVTELYRHLFGAVPCTAADVHRFDAAAAGLEAYAPPR
jgi:hypothetical protein